MLAPCQDDSKNSHPNNPPFIPVLQIYEAQDEQETNNSSQINRPGGSLTTTLISPITTEVSGLKRAGFRRPHLLRIWTPP